MQSGVVPLLVTMTRSEVWWEIAMSMGCDVSLMTFSCWSRYDWFSVS